MRLLLYCGGDHRTFAFPLLSQQHFHSPASSRSFPSCFSAPLRQQGMRFLIFCGALLSVRLALAFFCPTVKTGPWRCLALRGSPELSWVEGESRVRSNGGSVSFAEDMSRRLIQLGADRALEAVSQRMTRSDDSFPNVRALRPSVPPMINHFIVANPVPFLQSPRTSNKYGCDLSALRSDSDFSTLASQLPVIYLADEHTDYGMLGLQLNKKSGKTIGDLYGSLRSLRSQPVFAGGVGRKGASFTMLHRKAGFPKNRAWKSLPGKNDFKLFFSPDIAMANELCMTKDAKPEDFKFFEWATIWPPRQLDHECEKNLWLILEAPVEVIFAKDEPHQPLWSRLVGSIQKP